MHIEELTIQAFLDFANRNPLRNYMQTIEYARLMGEHRYNYDYIGLIDENGVTVGASLILWKKIGFKDKYGYAPKGFLLNYYSGKILKLFTDKIKEYYKAKGFAFIKINPEIVIGEIDNETLEFKENTNIDLKQELQKYGYLKLKDNLYFESMNPRFNAYIDLKNSNFDKFDKVHRNKIRNSKRKGLYIEKGAESDLEQLTKLFTLGKPLSYYKNMAQIFGDKMDIILVKADYEQYVKNSQNLYEKELDDNNLYNEILHRSHRKSDLNRKMASDSKLCTIKNEIIVATEGLRDRNNEIVAGAIVIKCGNRAHIVESGFNRNYSTLNAHYFLYDELIANYKDKFDFLDLGGISGDFKDTNPYRGLNKFKIGFDAHIYEYIGEFDLIINRSNYDLLGATGKLASEFNPKNRE